MAETVFVVLELRPDRGWCHCVLLPRGHRVALSGGDFPVVYVQWENTRPGWQCQVGGASVSVKHKGISAGRERDLHVTGCGAVSKDNQPDPVVGKVAIETAFIRHIHKTVSVGPEYFTWTVIWVQTWGVVCGFGADGVMDSQTLSWNPDRVQGPGLRACVCRALLPCPKSQTAPDSLCSGQDLGRLRLK